MLTEYELMTVLAPTASEDAVNAVLERVTRFVNDKGGSVEGQEPWGPGRRKLAYPINRHLEGNFIITRMQLPSQATAELESQLKINEQVLRHLLVKWQPVPERRPVPARQGPPSQPSPERPVSREV